VTRNALSIFSAQGINYVLSFVIAVLLIRYLGAQRFGEYSFIMAFLALFGFVMDIGLNQLIVREASRNREIARQYLGNFLQIQFLLSLITYVLLVVSINIFNSSVLIRYAVYVAGIGLIFGSLMRPFESILASFEKMHLNALINIAKVFFNSILILLVIFLKKGIIALAWAFVINNLFLLFFSRRICNKHCCKPIFSLDIPFCRQLIKDALPFALLVLLLTVQNKIGIVMLSKLRGNIEVGWYSVAYKPIDFLLIIASSVSFIFFPLFSRKFKSSLEEGVRILRILIKCLAAIGIPIALLMCVFAAKIISLLYGGEYNNSAVSLQIIIWLIPLIYASWIVTTALMSTGRLKFLIFTNGMILAFSIIMNLIFIPVYGFIAVSWVTLVAAIIYIIVLLIYIDSRVHCLDIISLAPALLISCLVMMTILFLLHNALVLFQVIAGIFGYSVTLLALRYFPDNEMKAIKELLRLAIPNFRNNR